MVVVSHPELLNKGCLTNLSNKQIDKQTNNTQFSAIQTQIKAFLTDGDLSLLIKDINSIPCLCTWSNCPIALFIREVLN